MNFLEAAASISVCLGKTETTVLLPFQETYVYSLWRSSFKVARYLEEPSIYLKWDNNFRLWDRFSLPVFLDLETQAANVDIFTLTEGTKSSLLSTQTSAGERQTPPNLRTKDVMTCCWPGLSYNSEAEKWQNNDWQRRTEGTLKNTLHLTVLAITRDWNQAPQAGANV